MNICIALNETNKQMPPTSKKGKQRSGTEQIDWQQKKFPFSLNDVPLFPSIDHSPKTHKQFLILIKIQKANSTCHLHQGLQRKFTPTTISWYSCEHIYQHHHWSTNLPKHHQTNRYCTIISSITNLQKRIAGFLPLTRN